MAVAAESVYLWFYVSYVNGHRRCSQGWRICRTICLFIHCDLAPPTGDANQERQYELKIALDCHSLGPRTGCEDAGQISTGRDDRGTKRNLSALDSKPDPSDKYGGVQEARTRRPGRA